MTDETIVMGWPLGAKVQQGLAERLQAAAKAKRTEIIACYCPETGFALICHAADGKCFFWECCGPMSEEQADNWIAGTDSSPSRVLM